MDQNILVNSILDNSKLSRKYLESLDYVVLACIYRNILDGIKFEIAA